MLSEFNSPTKVFDAQELANDLVTVLPSSQNLAVLDGGGVLAYLFLKRAGYKGTFGSICSVSRRYIDGRPVCEVQQGLSEKPELIIDDILASGQTLTSLLEPKNTLDRSGDLETGFGCLMASSNVPKGNKGYRFRDKSTIGEIDTLYCPQFVNGNRDQNNGNRKPAILSLRYLLTKAIDNDDYTTGYLARKFGGQKNAAKIADLVLGIDRSAIDLLRSNPIEFLQQNGGI